MKSTYLLRNFSVLAVATSLMATGCSKKLDEPTIPNSIQANNITAKEIPNLTLGLYSIHTTSLRQVYVLHDVYSDNLQSSAAYYSNFDVCNVPTNDTRINDLMTYRYRTIANANLIINTINDKNLKDLGLYKGQALLMRAHCYLELANSYGGVVITTGKESNPNRKQNTFEEVYDFAIRDLTEIIDNKLLPSFKNATEGNMQAAKALLARTYLQIGKNAEAKALALDIIQNPGIVKLTSAATFANNFTSSGSDAGKELLLKIQEGPITNPQQNGLFGAYTFSNYGTPTSYVVNNLYEATDVRRGYVATGKITKYPLDASPVYPLIRLSEVYLIEAEAEARLGNIDVTNYNKIRSNRGASLKQNSDFASTALFLAEIAEERNREFIAEGLRWQDMKRFGLALPHLQLLGADAGHILFPFNDNQLFSNPELTQNPGY